VDGKRMFYVTVTKNSSDLHVKKLKDNLQEVFGGSIECIMNEDQSLIGGLKIQYRSKILDYSVKSRLRRLHSAMRKENYGN
jgi:F0F1-type ATP synthase delta subunit